MAASYFRHQFHLYRSQIGCAALVALVALGPLSAQAQKGQSRAKRNKHGVVKSITSDNLPDYNDKWFHPGMYLGINYSTYRIQHSPSYIANQGGPNGVTANPINSPGFSVGFVGDARLVDFLSLRFAPGVSFMTRQIEFKPNGFNNAAYVNDPDRPEEIRTQEIGTTQIDLPLLLKFHSQRRRNTRVYMVGGIRPSFNVGSRRRDPENNLLRTNDADLALEYGVGLDLFYPLFKFAPEVRFSHGLTNLHQNTFSDVYNTSLQRMTSHTVTLYLNFE